MVETEGSESQWSEKGKVTYMEEELLFEGNV